jgi:hypothetical protein
MITREELRIGNQTLLGKVISLEPYIATIQGDRGTFRYKYEYVPPVTLREEELLKLGFKRWGKSKTYTKKGLIIHHRKRGFVIRKSFRDLHYVHQLQNVYLDLIGEPLPLINNQKTKAQN